MHQKGELNMVKDDKSINEFIATGIATPVSTPPSDPIITNKDERAKKPSYKGVITAAVVAGMVVLGGFAAFTMMQDDGHGQGGDNGGGNGGDGGGALAPDDFVDEMKKLGIEGEGWSDDVYNAAYDLQNNLYSMGPAALYDNFDKIINPHDPDGSVKLAKKILFPKQGESVIGESNAFNNINDALNDFYNSDYFSNNTRITLGGLIDAPWTAANTHNDLLPEADDYYNFMADESNANKITLDMNGREISVNNASKYLKAIYSVQGASYAKAVEQLGLEAAKALPAYQAWFAPEQGNGGGEIFVPDPTL